MVSTEAIEQQRVQNDQFGDDNITSLFLSQPVAHRNPYSRRESLPESEAEHESKQLFRSTLPHVTLEEANRKLPSASLVLHALTINACLGNSNSAQLVIGFTSLTMEQCKRPINLGGISTQSPDNRSDATSL